jgi:hypothetical protein
VESRGPIIAPTQEIARMMYCSLLLRTTMGTLFAGCRKATGG